MVVTATMVEPGRRASGRERDERMAKAVPGEALQRSHEFHVSSLLVQSRPEQTEGLARRIATLPAVEVPTYAPGRLVATLVCDDEGSILEIIRTIRGLPGVLSAELVFHRIERDEEVVG